MTRPGTHRWFTFAPAQRRNGNSWERLSLPVAIFIVFAFCAAAAIAAPAQSVVVFTTLASFNGANGASPYLMSLVQGADGDFYGTTNAGGANQGCSEGGDGGCGTVFKVTPSGILTTLYSFCSQPNCTDGYYPSAGLVLGHDGYFYGMTTSGGAYSSNNCQFYGACGTIFKISSSGPLTTLHSFCAVGPPCTDGNSPFGPLVLASDGDFYGTTANGGTYSAGTVFKITSGGVFTTLQSFDGSDGNGSYAGLVQASNSNFYGTTTWGGANHPRPCPPEGCGMVFRVTPSGTLTALYDFCSQPNCADGAEPWDTLVQGNDGDLYGTTHIGGNLGCNGEGDGCGTVFKITSAGALTTLHIFCSQVTCLDGEYPVAGLVLGNDGNFYGTTIAGGSYNAGTVFKMTPSGVLTTLHSFCSQPYCTDGRGGTGGLLQAPNGIFYGTTEGGGTDGDGTVFSLQIVPTCVACRP